MRNASQLRAELELKLQKVKEAERAEDRDRKILLGAFMLKQIEKNGIGFQLVTYESASFDEFLTRDRDRKLFGLQPLEKQKGEK